MRGIQPGLRQETDWLRVHDEVTGTKGRLSRSVLEGFGGYLFCFEVDRYSQRCFFELLLGR